MKPAARYMHAVVKDSSNRRDRGLFEVGDDVRRCDTPVPSSALYATPLDNTP